MGNNRILSALRGHKKMLISLTIVLLVICEFIFRFDNSFAPIIIACYRLILFPFFIFILLTCFDVRLNFKVYIIIASTLVSFVYFGFSKQSYGNSLFKQSYYLVTATVTKVAITSGTRFGTHIYIDYDYNWLYSCKKRESHRDVSGEVKKDNIKVGSKIFIQKHENDWGGRYKYNISKEEAYYYQYPVLFVKGVEFGNDYYYYAKLQPIISLNNFGLRRVSKSIENSDTILYYKNLNSTIDSVAHRLADTLQTAANRALVGSSFAFLFHDGIYTKEQVFEEIPEAKEYYYKYYKESE